MNINWWRWILYHYERLGMNFIWLWTVWYEFYENINCQRWILYELMGMKVICVWTVEDMNMNWRVWMLQDYQRLGMNFLLTMNWGRWILYDNEQLEKNFILLRVWTVEDKCYMTMNCWRWIIRNQLLYVSLVMNCYVWIGYDFEVMAVNCFCHNLIFTQLSILMQTVNEYMFRRIWRKKRETDRQTDRKQKRVWYANWKICMGRFLLFVQLWT